MPIPVVRQLGRIDYRRCWQAMQDHTLSRDSGSADEFWIVEHAPVYTLGLNNKTERPLRDDIEVVQTDRGGQITYHGPGQLVMYTMIDLKRMGIGIKRLVQLLEQSVIDLVEGYDVTAERRTGAPGVYVDGRKLAALGLRVKRDCSYHGLSLNCDMDLSPFSAIDPCGYQGLEVTQLHDLGIDLTTAETAQTLLEILWGHLGYNDRPETGPTELP